MIPSSAVGLLVFLGAVTPGYVYQRAVEGRVVRHSRSPWLQAVDLLCIGSVCSLGAAVLVLAVGEAFPGALVTLSEVSSNWRGTQNTPWRAALSGISVLVVGSSIAIVVAAFVSKLSPRSRLRPGTVWTSTFARYQPEHDRSGRTVLYIVAQLADGRAIGGQLLYGDQGEDPEKRDLTLAAPLWVSNDANRKREDLSYDFVILKGSEISAVWGRRWAIPATAPEGIAEASSAGSAAGQATRS